MQPRQFHLLGAHRLVDCALQFPFVGQPNPVAQRLLGRTEQARRHRRFLPTLDQHDGLQLELQRISRSLLRSVLLAHFTRSHCTAQGDSSTWAKGDIAVWGPQLPK